MRILKVDLEDRGYPIFIGRDLLNERNLVKDYIRGNQVMIVTNDLVNGLFGDKLTSLLSDVGQVDLTVLPDGESHKDLATLNLVFDQLLTHRHNRTTTLVALGGGVIGDMTGFAAACYQRGVAFIQVPTTLLAQVDSSVGGKTGVNHPLGKNMIGAFHQPECVVIDTGVLRSLPDRELSAGLAEVIKYGLIADQAFFCWLEQNMDSLLKKNEDALAYAIERSCQIKAEIVGQDEKESGVRALLNLGHTFGHAIEAHQGYGSWLHGEAVGAGMVMACEMSVRLGWLGKSWCKRATDLIRQAGLPVGPPESMTSESFMAHMSVDKKVLNGGLRLILLKDCGSAEVTSDFDQQALHLTLTRRGLE